MSYAGAGKIKKLLDGELVSEKKFAWLPRYTTNSNHRIWFKSYRRVIQLSWVSDSNRYKPIVKENIMSEKDYRLFHLKKIMNNETIYEI